MDYKDFSLQLDRAPGQSGFVTRVLRSSAGEAEAPFVNPVSPAELEILWQTAYNARQAEHAFRDLSVRRQTPARDVSLEEIGDRLFQALFRGPVRSCWARSYSEATQNSEGGLRLKLQLNLGDPLVAGLAELPWEYLFSPEHGGFLGLQRKTPILRHMRLPMPGSRPLPSRPIRLLAVLSQPRALSRLSLDEESNRIKSTLGALPGVDVIPLRNPSIETLREKLLEQDFQILHFMGHGGFDEHSGQGVLFFTHPNGSPLPVSGSLLGTHLAGMDSLRLIFINACETARSKASAPFAGVATALLRAGLPAVIAMQRPIGDDSALEFSRVVYRRLAVGDPIDAAVTEGRLAIARDNGTEWGTPVLFSRAEDGRIFSAEPPGAELASPITMPVAVPVSTPSSARQLMVGLVLAATLSIAVWKWPVGRESILPDPGPHGTPLDTAFIDTPNIVETPNEVVPGPGNDDSGNDVQPTPVPTPPPTVPTPAPDPPVVLAPSALVVTTDSPVHFSHLAADVGAKFFEREGYKLARFWVAPQGLGMLEQPPVMGPGTIAFPVPGGGGIYYLDVTSLDKEAQRATVRLRFTEAASR